MQASSLSLVMKINICWGFIRVQLFVYKMSIQVLRQHVWGWVGGLSKNADAADALEGRGGSQPEVQKIFSFLRA